MHPVTEYRKALRWSQSKLAAMSGVHATTISQIESGRLKPYPAQLAKLAAALGVSIRDLECGGAW